MYCKRKENIKEVREKIKVQKFTLTSCSMLSENAQNCV